MSKSLEIGSVNVSSCSSSSSNERVDLVLEDMSERDFCIHVLRNHGLLELGGGRGFHANKSVTTSDDSITCSRPCKTCGLLDVSVKMLICGHCEEAYHPSCYKLVSSEVLDDDEWFGHSCLKTKKKILNGRTTVKKPSFYNEMCGISRADGLAKGDVNQIELMLKDAEPYTTSVRIGKSFQAEVPL